MLFGNTQTGTLNGRIVQSSFLWFMTCMLRNILLCTSLWHHFLNLCPILDNLKKVVAFPAVHLHQTLRNPPPPPSSSPRAPLLRPPFNQGSRSTRVPFHAALCAFVVLWLRSDLYQELGKRQALCVGGQEKQAQATFVQMSCYFYCSPPFAGWHFPQC